MEVQLLQQDVISFSLDDVASLSRVSSRDLFQFLSSTGEIDRKVEVEMEITGSSNRSEGGKSSKSIEEAATDGPALVILPQAPAKGMLEMVQEESQLPETDFHVVHVLQPTDVKPGAEAAAQALLLSPGDEEAQTVREELMQVAVGSRTHERAHS